MFILKSKKRIGEQHGITNFDLSAHIVPLNGAGGVSFQNTLKDFEYLLTEKFFDSRIGQDLSIEVDNKNYVLTINVKDDALQIQFDIFSGKINYISCREGYKGSFNNTMWVGSKTKRNFFLENGIGFDLDLYWFSHYPFDGLIIYPPSELREDCWDAEASGKRYPEFTVKEITILDYDFAVKNFGTELRLP